MFASTTANNIKNKIEQMGQNKTTQNLTLGSEPLIGLAKNFTKRLFTQNGTNTARGANWLADKINGILYGNRG